MDLLKETYKVLGQRILPSFDSKSLVIWAIMLLDSGHETESLMILAGLDNDSTEIREKYFLKSISEIGIKINKTDIELVEYFVNDVAKEVIEGKMQASDGLSIMQKVLWWSGYHSKYFQFYQLEEDIDYLEEYGGVIFNSGLNLNNREHFIKEEFRLYLEIASLKINNETKEKSICNLCDQITKPKMVNKYQLKKPYKYRMFVCGNCGSENIEHFSSQNGKRRIIDRIKNHT